MSGPHMTARLRHLTDEIVAAGASLPAGDAGDWQEQVLNWARAMYRAGAWAQLSRDYDRLPAGDYLQRLRWQADRGLASAGVESLIAEVESAREKDSALTSTYGVTDTDIRSMVSEGFHTAFRKAVDHPYAMAIHKLLGELPGEDWEAVIDFVTGPVIASLREAQARLGGQQS